jgi:hypothetical protein
MIAVSHCAAAIWADLHIAAVVYATHQLRSAPMAYTSAIAHARRLMVYIERACGFD